jgi:hypothetical protein
LKGVLTCGGCGRKKRRRRRSAEAVEDALTPAQRPSTSSSATTYPPFYPPPADSRIRPSTPRQQIPLRFLFFRSPNAPAPSVLVYPSHLSPTSSTSPTKLAPPPLPPPLLALLPPYPRPPPAHPRRLPRHLPPLLHLRLPLPPLFPHLSHLRYLLPLSSRRPLLVHLRPRRHLLFLRQARRWVHHHYPSDPLAAKGDEARGSGESVVRLTKHTWETRGVEAVLACGGKGGRRSEDGRSAGCCLSAGGVDFGEWDGSGWVGVVVSAGKLEQALLTCFRCLRIEDQPWELHKREVVYFEPQEAATAPRRKIGRQKSRVLSFSEAGCCVVYGSLEVSLE